MVAKHVVKTLEPHKPGDFQFLALERWKHRLVVGLGFLEFLHHVTIGNAVGFFDLLHGWQRIVLFAFLIVRLGPLLRLLEFSLENFLGGHSRRWRTELLIERVPAPRRLDQQHRLAEVLAHHVSELEFRAGLAG